MTPVTFFVTAPQILIVEINGRIVAHGPATEFNRNMHAQGARKYSAAGIRGVIHVDRLTFNRRSEGRDLVLETDEIDRAVANISETGIRHAMHHIALKRLSHTYHYQLDAKTIFEEGTRTFERVQDWFEEQMMKPSTIVHGGNAWLGAFKTASPADW